MIKMTQLATNFSRVDLDKISIYFSYETPIGLDLDGETIKSENIWSRTTGKHLGQIFGNTVPHQEFEQKMNACLAHLGKKNGRA